MPPAASPAGSPPRHTTSRAPLPATICPSRAAGNPGSSGTYAAPASQHPTIAVTSSKPRPRHNPTTVSGPAPWETRNRASRPARTASSP